MEQKTFGVHHIALKACGLAAYEKTIEFYHNILGMPVVRTWGEGENVGTMLDIGGGMKSLPMVKMIPARVLSVTWPLL